MSVPIVCENYKSGKLTAKYVHHKNHHGNYWLCECECGNTTIVRASNLTSGKTKSCGCLRPPERIITKNTASNTSGKVGVHYNSRTRRWEARITFRKEVIYLGGYKDIEDAIEAREQEEKWLLKKYGESMAKRNLKR